MPRKTYTPKPKEEKEKVLDVPKVKQEKAVVLPVPQSTSIFFPEEKQENQISISDELKLKMVDEVYSREDIELKSRVNNHEVIVHAKAQLFAEYYNVPMIQKLSTKILELKISLDGKGRKEFVEVAKSLIAPNQEEQQSTIPQRLFGESR
jgi:hypothetical protein